MMTKTATTTVAPDQVRALLGKHMLTDGYDLVLDLERSQGPHLIDAATGKRYLDLFTFFAANALGMNHPALTEPDFVAKLGRVAINKPSNSDVYTPEMAAFVETFDRVGIPDYLPYAFFVSGGALAVENALKVAFDWKVQKNQRKGHRGEVGTKVLHFEQAFHGRSGYTLSLTNTDPVKVARFPKFDWPRVKNPVARFPLEGDNLAQTIADEELALAQAERHFERHGDDIAAIIIEPIQGEGGDNHFRLEFHQALRQLADEREALLIYDEVQTGVGLTGAFWAHEHYVRPDIIAFGKKTQVCGILASRRIDDIPTHCFRVSSRINSTFGGNLVDMVRFGRILEVIEAERLVENAARQGAYLLDRVEALVERHDFLSGARGKGLMVAFDFATAELRDWFARRLFEEGVIMLPCGTRAMRFRPALTITREDLDEALSVIEGLLDEAAARA